MTEKIVNIVENEARSKRGTNVDESSVHDEQTSKEFDELSINDSDIIEVEDQKLENKTLNQK